MAENWREAGRALVAKAIAELSYEELLRPEPADDGYRVAGHAFRATRGGCGHWTVDPASVRLDGAVATDPVAFLLAAAPSLGLDGVRLAEAVDEVTATWTADAHLLATTPTAAGLADAGTAELEAWQSGHPGMVLNKGRLGFSAADARAYAPEHGNAFRLPWLAVHESLASHHGVPARTLLAGELDEDTYAGFAAEADPDSHVWLPVHPFHLDAVVRTLFAPYLAEGRVVELGEAPDRYRPLASVRTLVDVDRPERHMVKLPLQVRNTLVWRGLPPESTAAAPDVTAWLRGIRAADPYLRDVARFDILGEVASVAVTHPVYHAVEDAPYRYHELLGAVWREPVDAHLAAGERARSLAATLQVGSDGRALVTELVARSGLGAVDWLRRLAHAVLPGLLHYLHAYGVAFCPHGENTVVVYDAAGVPDRILVKDLADDVNVLTGDDHDAPDVLLRWPREELAHSILSALVAGHFRHLAPVVHQHLGVPESTYWRLLRDEVDAYRDTFPEARSDPYGLTADDFGRVCLNTEQLTGGSFHDRAEKDESFDVVSGRVANPLAKG